MSLSELLPAVHALSVTDKWQLLQILVDELVNKATGQSPDGPNITPPAHLSPRQQLLWRGARATEIL